MMPTMPLLAILSSNLASLLAKKNNLLEAAALQLYLRALI